MCAEMPHDDLVLGPGRIYLVAGRGVMNLVELPDPTAGPRKTTVMLLAHGNLRYWVRPSEIVREATPQDLLDYLEQAVPRGVDCKDADCWCRPMLVQVASPLERALNALEMAPLPSADPALFALQGDPEAWMRAYRAWWDGPRVLVLDVLQKSTKEMN